MKICPFVSHMLGDENYHTLTLGDSPDNEDEVKSSRDTIELGYEGPDSPSTPGGKNKGKRRTTSSVESEDTVPSHLYCLKESCRFYQGATDECQFDVMFSMLEQQKSNNNAGEISALTDRITKDVDKIWKFQTKSVEQLVKTFGEADKSHSERLDNLKKNVDKTLKNLSAKLEQSPATHDTEELGSLRMLVEDRQQSIEDLSTTMSDLVLNLHDSITNLEDKSKEMAAQFEKLEATLPKEENIRKAVDSAVSKSLKNLEAQNTSGPIELVERKLENFRRDGDEIRSKIEETLTTQNALESRVSDWDEKLTGALNDLREHRESWAEKLLHLEKSQLELIEHLEENKKHLVNDQARTGKKEARKLNNLGVTSFHNGAFGMARDQFLQAVKVDPEFAEAYNNLGLAYTELGEEEKASDAFLKAVQLNPSLHAAYNNLGYIFFRQGNYDQAIEMYNEALGRSTDNSSAYTNLGNAYYKLGKTDEAHKAWTKALELDPGNEKARRNLQRISENSALGSS